MTEEIIQEEVVESSPVQQLATEYGWKPDGKKSAEDYIKFALEKLPERGEALASQNKKLEAKDGELNKMRNMLEELTVHMKKQKDEAYKQALNEFKEQKRQAILEGNVDLVEQLESQGAPQQETIPECIKDFEERNASWLNGDSLEDLEMQDWVQRHGALLGRKQLPTDQHMDRLEKDLRKKFPTYFEKDESGMYDAVEGSFGSGVAKVSNKKVFTFKDLSSAQKEVAKYLKDAGHMTVDEYIQELVKYGDLK